MNGDHEQGRPMFSHWACQTVNVLCGSMNDIFECCTETAKASIDLWPQIFNATATVLMDTYAHTQDKPRLELTEKIEADFYTQDVAGAKPQEPPENKTPVATKITGKMILEAIRQMDAEERRELTRVLFA